MKLLLFDLDGTLVSTGGAGLRALDRAFLNLHRLVRAMDGVSAAGKTDPLIIREVFNRKLRREPLPLETSKVCEHYLWFLKEELLRSGEDYRVIDGVRTVVEALAAREDVLLALGTGNLEKGARIKLEPAGMNRYFALGGFGSDAEHRPDVLRAAVRRAEEKAGRAFREKDVFVIGDTILDVSAGKAIGATTVAVASGHGKPQELRDSRPDIFMGSFLEPAPLLEGLEQRVF